MRRISKVIAVLLLLFETLFNPGLVSAIENKTGTGGETGYWCYGDPNSTNNYEKFTMVAPDGKESIVYCYNHDKVQPVADKGSAEQYCKYERFGFYDGMANLGNNRGDQGKINEVAAALMVGYPNNGLGAPMEEYAKKCYQTFMETTGSRREPGYSIEDFKREMTQAAIWQIDQPTGRYIQKSEYAKTIYDYAKKYPLDKDTAYATNVKLVDENSKEINLTNPLIVNPDTLQTQTFKMTGYNGIATLDSLPKGYQVIDNSTDESVSGIKPNQTYHIKANSQDNTQFEVKLKIMTMRDSYFYQPVGSPWDLQNMVNSKVTRDEFKAPIILMNKPVKEVSINKKDNSGTPVSNAKLVILDSKSQEVDSWTTNGETHKVSLVDGSYTLKETEVPEGYKQASPIQFKVENGNLYVNNSVVDAINMIDEKINSEKPVQKTEVSIEKVDSDKTPVNGAELTITNAESGKVDSWTTDGTVHKVSLVDGEYTLTETKVPKGYKQADPIPFTVKDGQVLVNQQPVDVITMIDKKVIPSTPIVPAKHKVVLSKQNIAGEEIDGAHLTLSTGGHTVESWISKKGTNHEFFAEVNKEYILTETQAPEGYEIAESITFRVTEDGKVEVKNGSQWDSLEDNKVIMVDQYKKEEPITPGGKPNLPETPIMPNDDFHNEKSPNHKENTGLVLPQTGSKTIKYLPIVGGVLVVAAMAGLLLGFRKKQK